jgi:hypothetical protein
MSDVAIPITFSALYQRLNRHLKKEGCVLRRGKGRVDNVRHGDWYVFDREYHRVPRHHVDPEALARELGILHAWETVEDAEKQGEHDASY